MNTLLRKTLTAAKESLGRRVRVGLIGLGTTNSALLEHLCDMKDLCNVTVRQAGLSRTDIPHTVAEIASDTSHITEDIVFPSPSVRREKLTAPHGTEMLCDYDLLFRSEPEHLFLVSGSDGKSTTVSMASELLFPRFPDLFTGGNLGVPLWHADARSSAFLLELSSFTLRYSLPRGGRALLTNVTPNHLDWHADLEEYRSTKLSLIRAADEPILCIDDPVSQMEAKATRVFCLVSLTRTRAQILAEYRTEHTVTLEDGAIRLDGEIAVSLSGIKHRERHNVIDLASAIALAIGYTDEERIREVAAGFSLPSERCECIEIGGVDYISSSIDTTPLRTRTTLEGLDRRVRLILGGRGKGLSPEPLREPIMRYATRIAIYGEIADELATFIDSTPELAAIPHRTFGTLAEATDYATEGVCKGETVLLSPAATSYGEFRDYIHRGECFRSIIRKNASKAE